GGPNKYCPSVFTTSSALRPTDFNSFGAVLFSAAWEGRRIYANFYSVDHSPNPIGMEGGDLGQSLSKWYPGRFKVIERSLPDAGRCDGMSAFDDDPDLFGAIADATNDYLQNNTDPTWITA